MSQFSEFRQRIQKLLGDSVSQVSSAFMNLSAELKSSSNAAPLQKGIDKVFKMIIDTNRTLSQEVNSLLDHQEKHEQHRVGDGDSRQYRPGDQRPAAERHQQHGFAAKLVRSPPK